MCDPDLGSTLEELQILVLMMEGSKVLMWTAVAMMTVVAAPVTRVVNGAGGKAGYPYSLLFNLRKTHHPLFLDACSSSNPFLPSAAITGLRATCQRGEGLVTPCQNGTTFSDGTSHVPWLDQLRKLHELRPEVQFYNVSIMWLQLKVKRLEEEREKEHDGK